jgi:hypothetical protein
MVAATMGFLLQGIEIREMKAVFSPHITLGTASGSHRTTAQTPPQEHGQSGGDFMEGLMIEKLVTSLEVSKRLKELGVRQQSCFYWIRYELEPKYFLLPHNEVLDGYEPTENETSEYPPVSAFTCTELAAMMGSSQSDIDPNIEAEGIIIGLQNGFDHIDQINANIARFWEGQ